MTKQITEKIKLWGIVQGVGFRPYVAKTASRMGMKGEVLNIGGLVEIVVTDTPERIDEFVDSLIAEKPGPAEIVHVKRDEQRPRSFDSFTIIKSDEGDDEAAMIPADLAICPSCLDELYDIEDPRYQHPFISCQLCGPRYTIIDRIPYDRDNTSMIDFPMCGFCEKEYTDLHDRRHHAQTISCHECGPVLIWRKGTETTGGSLDADAEILSRAADELNNGNVIAFKSVGGYNLVADPFNDEAVAELRRIKNRESKPFAVMFRSLDEIRRYCEVNEVEARLLQSSARPIILLEHKLAEFDESDGRGKSFADLRRSRFIGSFLPSFAAQYMLLDRISPLIFTSANPSDMPMIKDEDEMFAFCGTSISGILYNKRKINVRVDDSVTRVIDGQPQMIRRSKGYAPVPLYVASGSGRQTGGSGRQTGGAESKFSMLACGGQLKNSFALTKGPFAYVSQFFGDMDSIENQTIYRENINHMSQLFRIKPQAVVCDMHPFYWPSEYGRDLAEMERLPLIEAQHHHAHVASVMAENNLEGQVIGVAFDGTGYGTDGAIWGGEFLLCEGGEFQRKAHLKYVDMIGGDSSVKDARRSALSYAAAYDKGYMDAGSKGTFLRDDSEEIRIDIGDIIEYGVERLISGPKAELIMKALENGINSIRSSSMGRLFDGVSALLGIKEYNEYEGQCAIMLEDAAAFAKRHPGESRSADMALKFHEEVTRMIIRQCGKIREETGVNQVALTGGTFQNKILMEGTLEGLRKLDFEPYYNISVSPNDGGIALGQAFIGMHKFQLNERY